MHSTYRALRGMSLGARREVMDEVASHIREHLRIAGCQIPKAFDLQLRLLKEPDQLIFLRSRLFDILSINTCQTDAAKKLSALDQAILQHLENAGARRRANWVERLVKGVVHLINEPKAQPDLIKSSRFRPQEIDRPNFRKSTNAIRTSIRDSRYHCLDTGGLVELQVSSCRPCPSLAERVGSNVCEVVSVARSGGSANEKRNRDAFMTTNRPIHVAYLFEDLAADAWSYRIGSVIQRHFPGTVRPHLYNLTRTPDKTRTGICEQTLSSTLDFRDGEIQAFRKALAKNPVNLAVALCRSERWLPFLRILSELGIPIARWDVNGKAEFFYGYDYFLCDTEMLASKTEYASALPLRLPHSMFPLDNRRVFSPARSMDKNSDYFEERMVVGYFGRVDRIDESLLDSWLEVLEQCGNVSFWVLPEVHEFFVQHAAQRKYDGNFIDRVVLQPIVHAPTHLTRLRQCTLILDSFPQSSPALCHDALIAGIPVVTCVSDEMQSRYSASLLKQLGLEILVAESARGYVARIVDILSNSDRYSVVKKMINLKITGKNQLFPEYFVRSLEEVLLSIRLPHPTGWSIC